SYRKIHKDKEDFIFHPIDIRDYAGGVYFVSSYFHRAFCVEKNDTIRTISTKDLFLNATGIFEESYTKKIKRLGFRNGKFYKTGITDYHKHTGEIVLKAFDPYFIIYGNGNVAEIINYETDTTANIFFDS